MTSCCCTPTTVTFAGGVVLERCAAHEVHTWLVDGRPAARADVLPVLKDLFVERRGERSGAPKVVRLQARRSYAPVSAGADDGERLTALLHARGLPGTWAVA